MVALGGLVWPAQGTSWYSEKVKLNATSARLSASLSMLIR
jgi:hypothetical protein